MKTAFHLVLVVLLSLSGLAPSYAQSFVSGEIIIRFADGELDNNLLTQSQQTFSISQLVNDSELVAMLEKAGGTELRRLIPKFRPTHVTSTARTGESVVLPALQNLMLLSVSPGADIVSLSADLTSEVGILYAEPNYLREFNSSRKSLNTPSARKLTAQSLNDPEYANQTSLHDGPGNSDINADGAWAFEVGKNITKACVLDSGIDYHHPDLGNGAFNVPGAKVRGGWDFGDNDSNPDDEVSGHGTQVAGILGALRNNSIGVAGIAGGDGQESNTGAQLFALKVRKDDGSFPVSASVAAIIEGATSSPGFGYGCHLLNLSYGGGERSESEREALFTAALNGAVVVISKSNGCPPPTTPQCPFPGGMNLERWPADFEQSWIINTGASDANNERKDISHYGFNLDLVAPGDPSMVYTTQVTAIEGDPYGGFEETSAAAPHVAGVAALINTVDQDFGLDLHPEDVEGLIKASAVKLPNYTFTNDYNVEVGYGLLDAEKALEMLHMPWQLTHATSQGGTNVGQVGSSQIIEVIGAPGLSEDEVYKIERYEVQKTVTFPAMSDVSVWGRGANASIGWSSVTDENVLYAAGFSELVPGFLTSTSAVLRTYVYKVWEFNAQGQEVWKGWYPAEPANVVFAYTVHGKSATDAGLKAKVYLHGPYNTTNHDMDTGQNDEIPNAQPYSDPMFDGYPMDYDGAEAASITSDIVDWIIVELRTGTDPSTIVSQRAALLREDGRILDADGSDFVLFPGVTAPGGYRIVIRHRNHLPIMSGSSLILFAGDSAPVVLDLSSLSAYGGDPQARIELETGVYGMYGADGNFSGDVTAFDYLNVWLPENGTNGYKQGDFNLDGSVTSFDFLQIWLNANGRASQVPDPAPPPAAFAKSESLAKARLHVVAQDRAHVELGVQLNTTADFNLGPMTLMVSYDTLAVEFPIKPEESTVERAGHYLYADYAAAAQ